MTKPLPDVETLKSLFEYKETDGTLLWKARPREMFSSERQFARWNKYYAGIVAGRISSHGYRVIKVFSEGFTAHRLVWKMITGNDPGEIDHINRDKMDNRISNLRDVSRSANMLNKDIYANNKSGHRHVVWFPRLKKWTVQLSVPGKGQRQMAYCDTIEEAVEMRNRLYEELGYYK